MKSHVSGGFLAAGNRILNPKWLKTVRALGSCTKQEDWRQADAGLAQHWSPSGPSLPIVFGLPFSQLHIQSFTKSISKTSYPEGPGIYKFP